MSNLNFFTPGKKLWLKSGAYGGLNFNFLNEVGAYDKPVTVTLETTDPNQAWVKPVNGKPFLIKLTDVKCVAGFKD